MTDILWASAPEVLHYTPDPTLQAPPNPGYGNVPILTVGATLAPVAGGLTLTVPAVPGATEAQGAFALFSIDPPLPSVVTTDDRRFRLAFDLHMPDAVTGISPQVVLYNAATPGTKMEFRTIVESYSMIHAASRPYELRRSDYAAAPETAAFYLDSPAVAAWFAGADPIISVGFLASPIMGPMNIPAFSVTMTNLRLEVQDAAGPPPTPPAAVRYRDPADGQFKPLSQIGARGYPAPPAEHVFSTDEPTGADRKQFWISTPVKYGPDRTTQQYPVPLTGTPAQGDPGAGVTHRGSARTENGSIIVTQPAGTFTTSTGCAFTTTFQFPGTADPLDVRPEEAVRATFRVRMTLAGYASNAGVTQPVFSAGTMSIAGGTPFNIAGYLSWNADGVQTFAPVVTDRAQIDALVAGCEIAVFLSLSATMFMPTTATFPELTLTVDPMTVEYTSIPPMMAVLKELVNDVYQPVSYPPV